MSLLGLMVIGVTAAYGSQTSQPKMNGKLKVTTLSPEEICYTGKPYSKELGVYVFNYRNYDPQTSRWTTPDPSGFPDGANNNIYIANNVLNAIDATGKSITLYNHSVALLGYHAYIAYSDVQDPNGGPAYNGTLSAEAKNPDGLLTGYGNLTAVVDLDSNSAQGHAFTLNAASYGYSSDYCLLQDLQGAFNSYGNNLPYTPTPGLLFPGHYNSNGFINGLLTSLGITNTGYSGFGWSEAVPFSYTEQYQKADTQCVACQE